MIEIMLQSMGITTDDVDGIKKLVAGLNTQPAKIDDLTARLERIETLLTKLTEDK